LHKCVTIRKKLSFIFTECICLNRQATTDASGMFRWRAGSGKKCSLTLTLRQLRQRPTSNKPLILARRQL